MKSVIWSGTLMEHDILNQPHNFSVDGLAAFYLFLGQSDAYELLKVYEGKNVKVTIEEVDL